MSALKWTLYLLAALGIGILIGLPEGAQSGEQQRSSLWRAGTASPVAEFSDEDYHADNGKVRAFARWLQSPLCENFQRQYPPSSLSRDTQQRSYQKLIAAAEQRGELGNVIEGCAMRAITVTDAAEAADARASGVPKSHPACILAYAQRATYFGQDVWCFLCLGTADGQHGSIHVIVTSCVPSFGLVHIEKLGSY